MLSDGFCRNQLEMVGREREKWQQERDEPCTGRSLHKLSLLARTFGGSPRVAVEKYIRPSSPGFL